MVEPKTSSSREPQRRSRRRTQLMSKEMGKEMLRVKMDELQVCFKLTKKG